MKLILLAAILLLMSLTAHSQSEVTEKQKQEAIKTARKLKDCIAFNDTLCYDLNTANIRISHLEQNAVTYSPVKMFGLGVSFGLIITGVIVVWK